MVLSIENSGGPLCPVDAGVRQDLALWDSCYRGTQALGLWVYRLSQLRWQLYKKGFVPLMHATLIGIQLCLLSYQSPLQNCECSISRDHHQEQNMGDSYDIVVVGAGQYQWDPSQHIKQFNT